MYERMPANIGALPRWLTPPSWLRNIAGSVFKGTKVTIPTPAGPQTFDLGNPADVAALKKLLTGAKVSTSVGQQPTNPLDQANRAVQENIPGGWLTIIGLGLAGFFLVRALTQPRRRSA